MSAIAVQFSHVPAARPASSASRRTRLRLTRRGRLVLTALAAAPVIAATAWFGVSTGSASADNRTTGAEVQHVTVLPGQSLWQVAEAVAPNADPRDVVDAIVDMNALQTTVVTPGETLAVPPQYAK